MNEPQTPVEADVTSPCVNICTLDPAGRYCVGCFRTLGEIAVWGSLDAADRRAVVAALPARRAKLAPMG